MGPSIGLPQLAASHDETLDGEGSEGPKFEHEMGAIEISIPSQPAAPGLLPCRGLFSTEMSWYPAWLLRELELLPANLGKLIPGETLTERSHSIMSMSSAMAQFTRDNKCSSIDEIVERLTELQYLRQPYPGSHTLHRALVFTILGWTSMVYKVLLSYRLLFGQSAKARRQFRHGIADNKAGGLPFAGRDDVLSLLCTSRNPVSIQGTLPEDHAVYYTPRDFCILCERIQLIAKELEEVRPKSMRDLVRDSRDKLQYWTFWLVCIIGGISILLGLIQAILQAVHRGRDRMLQMRSRE